LSAETLPRIWQELLAQAGPLLASELGKAEVPAISGPNTLVLRFPLQYNQAREHCQEPVRVTRIEELLRKITGRAWQVRIDSAGNGAATTTTTGAKAAPATTTTTAAATTTTTAKAEAAKADPATTTTTAAASAAAGDPPKN